MDKKDYALLNTMIRLANKGARAAQKEAHRLGLPNVYFIGGKPVYEMPNGDLRLKYKY
ncbi:hypothetical protein NO1_0861 [Candidatus Termititenax aidoneus]|uniref:Uncharacterized protein n=1 Tax=Termititenax aidoneus TaxID=2218524 RepID=A0A388TB31_TERA1|nr:hypothetical protein NO1_0861 [Candidatus Termititenax aidoneus]